MTDFEETTGNASEEALEHIAPAETADAPEESAAPPASHELNSEYVRDLLSRLKETMAVIGVEEADVASQPEVIPPAPVLSEDAPTPDDTPVKEESAPSDDADAPCEKASQADTPDADGEDDGTPPWDDPAEEASEDAAEDIAEDTAVEDTVDDIAEEIAEDFEEADTAVEVAVPPVSGDAVVEELSLDGVIDALIAESRERKREAPAATARSAAVTEEMMAAASASIQKKPLVLPDPPIIPEPPVASAQPASPDGIWAMASVASEAVAAEKKAHRRRFHARLVRRSGDASPKIREIGDASPLFKEEAGRGEEGIGALRPQDFFIADLRHEEELSTGETEEYVSRNQIETVLNGYAVERRRVTTRFFLSLALTLFILVFENLPLLGVSVCELFGIAPRIYALLDIGLLTVLALLVLDIIKDGVGELFSWQPSGAAIMVLSLAVSLLLLLLSLILGVADVTPLCALPAALAVTMKLGFMRLHIRDDEKTFLHLCESGDKLAAEILPSAYATEESASLGRRLRNVLRVKKVGFVTGYFARTRRRCEDYRLHAVLVIVALSAILLGTVLYAILLPKASAAMVLSFSSWLAAPIASAVFFAARRLPFHHLVELADAHGTAVLGEAAAEEYAAVDAVAFEDVEAFPSRKVRVRRIKMYDNSRLDELLYYMASVFSVLGGPLDGIFRVSASELGISDRVTIHTIVGDGIDATVDGHRVQIGKWGYYPKAAVEPYYDTEDVYKEDAGNISILYVSVDGAIGAKLYIEYNMSRRFEKLVRRLRKNGVTTLVRSFDPGIDDALLATTAHYPGLVIRAVRKKPEQICDFAEARVDSGLVTGAGSRDLLYTFLLCQSYRKVTAIGRLLKILSIPVTLTAAVLYALLARVPTFFSVYAAGLSLFWLLPILFISHFYFKQER